MKGIGGRNKKVMNMIHKTVAREHVCNALALLAFFAAMTPGADGKHRAVKPSEPPATVAAYMPSVGVSDKPDGLHEHGGKPTLYISANSNAGAVVVDVTNPDQPNVKTGRAN